MLKIFRKRRNVFIRLIHEQASYTLEGMDILKKYLSRPDEMLADQLTAKEKEADESRRILIDELNRTFITPLIGRIFSLFPARLTTYWIMPIAL